MPPRVLRHLPRAVRRYILRGARKHTRTAPGLAVSSEPQPVGAFWL